MELVKHPTILIFLCLSIDGWFAYLVLRPHHTEKYKDPNFIYTVFLSVLACITGTTSMKQPPASNSYPFWGEG